ncbi:hypothetical protein [Jonesia quinghaiensis]|uniref:hypothetical protein n=1 Tax=Jonesia quinghaiensis TaxID=262806 RepID=UPI0012F70CA0|nr:hypothetical protein [Jonesia quinghaiensis]
MNSIVGSLLIVLLLASCGATPDESSATPQVIGGESLDPDDYERDMKATAILDGDTGEIVLPLEQFFMSRDEQSKVDGAIILSMASCIHDAGYPALWVPFGERERKESQRYGRWVLEYAEKYGYSDIPDLIGQEIRDHEVAFGQYYSEEVNIPEYDKVIEDCGGNGEDSEIIASAFEDGAPPEVLEMRQLSYNLMKETPEAQAAENEWRQCVEEEGLVVEEVDNEYAIKDVSYIDADEDSIRAAIIDVRCKEKTDLIKRLSDIEASYQAPILKKYEAELVEMRSSVEESIAAVDVFMNNHKKEAQTLEALANNIP